MSTQAIAYGSVFLIVAAITLLGCWLQWRWWIIGRFNRWKAARRLREIEPACKTSPDNLVVKAIKENPRAFDELVKTLKEINK
jgi:hypothetical protein